MKRLTERDQYSQDCKIQAKNLDYHCVAKDKRGYVTYYGEHIDKLAEYEDLEEQGLLLRLPCKVGTKVYAINRIIDYGEVGDESTYSYSIIEREFQIYMMMEYGELVFGKTVFLTQAEAEQKLKEMESD